MESLTPLLALSFVTYTIINLARYLRARDWNGALTTVAVWVGGFLATLVFAESKIGEGIVLPLTGGLPLGALSTWDMIIVGLAVGSTATVANEFRGAFDNSTSTAKPHLLTGNTVRTDNVVVDPPPPNQ